MSTLDFSHIKAVLFDLDGTLVDTAPDLIAALNLTLEEQGYPPADHQSMRPFASHGALALINAALPNIDQQTQETLRQRLIFWYQNTNGQAASLFNGMESLLSFLTQRHIKIGVITNKPACFTRPLLDKLGLTSQMSCIISGDTCTSYKPDPAPMLLGAMQSHCLPSEIIYLGDAERDLLAAQATKMTGAVALWGYLSQTDKPEDWPATLRLSSPEELITYL